MKSSVNCKETQQKRRGKSSLAGSRWVVGWMLVLTVLIQLTLFFAFELPLTNNVFKKRMATDLDCEIEKKTADENMSSVLDRFFRPEKKKSSNIIVIVHSGASLSEARTEQRNTCGPIYKSRGIDLLFAVGRPSQPRPPNSHIQPHTKVVGKRGTKLEQDLSNSLLEEHEKFKDIIITPHRDYYLDLSDKLLGVLRYGVEANVDYIFKMDDEYCLNVDVAERMIREHETNHPFDELYVGWYLWQGTEFNNMLGPNNETSKFMSGAAFGISRQLAQTIVGPDWVHSALWPSYGNSADDCNVGKWIDYAMEKHNLTVQIKESKFLIDWKRSPGALRSLKLSISKRTGWFKN